MSALTVLGESTIPLPSLVSDLDVLADALDRATPEARRVWLHSLGGREVRALWTRAEGRPVAADALVRGDGVTIAEGRNTVPIFSTFQKRFARMADGRIAGYNHQGAFPTWFVGTGPFVATDGPQPPGEAWIDYRVVHPEAHPDFPPALPNERGFWPWFVYGNQVDVLRAVSAHVLVGEAFRVKNDVWKRRNFWFVLLFDAAR